MTPTRKLTKTVHFSNAESDQDSSAADSKRESRLIVKRLHSLRESEGVSSVLDHGITLRGASLAYFVDEATAELLGTWMLTFRPDSLPIER